MNFTLKRLFLFLLVLLLWLGITPRAQAAPAYVQGISAINNGTSTSAVFSSNVTAGDLIAVSVTVSSSATTINSVTATCVSGNFTLLDNPTVHPAISAAFAQGYAIISSSGSCTVTVNVSTSDNTFITAQEVSGINTTSPLDGHVMNSQDSPGTGTDAVTSGNITTTQNGDYIFGVGFDSSSNDIAWTAGTGFTNRLNITKRTQTEDKIQTSAGLIAATFTINIGWAHPTTGIMAFKPYVAAAGKAITSFNFNSLTPNVNGVITESSHTISLTVPYSTNVTNLVPTIALSSGASVSPNTGTANDFTNPTTYIVTASDSTTQNYTVTVTVSPPLPVVTAFTMPSTYTALTVPITSLTGNTSVIGYLITESSTTPSTTDVHWTSSAPVNFIFSGDGARTAYAWTKDASGDISTSISQTVTITLNQLIDPSRKIDWSQSGIPGGIPTRTTICATIDATTYGNDNVDATTTIQTALNNCGVNQVVFIPAGTYLIDGNIKIPSNVTLRGSGPKSTILDAHGTGLDAVISFGTNSEPSISNSVSITAGATAGSSTLTLSSTSGISAGSYLMLSELNDPNFVTITGTGGSCTWCDGGLGWNGTRALGQIVEVESINGSQVNISPSLYLSYPDSLSPLATPFTAGAKYAGAEDLQVYMNNTGYQGNFEMDGSAYCWIKDVESNYTDGDHVDAYFSYRGEIRDSYFHDAFTHLPGQHDADIFIASKSSGFLVENNILRRLHVAVMLNWGAAGNVISYNYTDGSFDQGATNVLIGGLDMHGANPSFNLNEGNIMETYHPDGTWGSNSYNTAFRNWFTGTTKICNPTTTGRATEDTSSCWWAMQAARAINIDSFGRFYNLVGNVVGSPDSLNLKEYNGVTPLPAGSTVVFPQYRSYDASSYTFSFGYGGASDSGTYAGGSSLPYTTSIISGNYDYALSATSWDNHVSTQTLPSSLYLSSKPSWFGNLAWPAIGPDVTGGQDTAGYANFIPAEYCYQKGEMPNCLYPSSDKTITSFTILSNGTIDEVNHTIAISVPYGTNVTNLTPTITISAGASISPNTGIANNFSSPTTYIVTAADGSTQNYLVTVIVAAENITSTPIVNPVVRTGSSGAVLYAQPISTNTLGCVSTGPFNIITGKLCPQNTTTDIKTSNSFIFTLLLSRGSTGTEVQELQKKLATEKIYSGKIDGIFGKITQKSVEDYQNTHNLKVDGIVGVKTRQVLNYNL